MDDQIKQIQEDVATLQKDTERIKLDYDHHTHDGINSQPIGGSSSSKVLTMTTGGSSYTIDARTYDMIVITAQDAGITFANPTGSPSEGKRLLVRIKDDSTPRAIAFGSEFRATTIALPTTTTASKWLYMGFMRNDTDSKWDLVASTVTA